MSSLWPVLGLAAAAAITPGPNNLLVLAAVRRGGLPAAARTIAGVLAGSMVLYGLVALGLAPVRTAVPAAAAIALAGAAYLGALAVAMLRQAGRDVDEVGAGAGAGAGPGPGPLPKRRSASPPSSWSTRRPWVLMTTVVAAAPASVGAVGLAVAVSSGLPGLPRRLGGARSAAAVDRVLAAGLLACARSGSWRTGSRRTWRRAASRTVGPAAALWSDLRFRTESDHADQLRASPPGDGDEGVEFLRHRGVEGRRLVLVQPALPHPVGAGRGVRGGGGGGGRPSDSHCS